MDFPAYPLTKEPITVEIIDALGITPTEVYSGRDLLCIFDDENIIKNFTPNLDKIQQLKGLLLHITAPGKTFDCISRSFAPKLNVKEDPVCGSGHCHIIPYWAKKLGKNTLTAYQASERGGVLYCEQQGERIKLSGEVALYAKAEIYVG